MNLANHSLAARQSIADHKSACLIAYNEAKRLAEQKAAKGKNWRAWVIAELETMSNAEMVKRCLNKRLKL